MVGMFSVSISGNILLFLCFLRGFHDAWVLNLVGVFLAVLEFVELMLAGQALYHLSHSVKCFFLHVLI
jgi:hypothetical protein